MVGWKIGILLVSLMLPLIVAIIGQFIIYLFFEAKLKMKVQLEFKVQDCWVGAFWKREEGIQHLWVCVIPMFPVHIIWPAEKL